jgi:ABC-type sugar transport system ATPase subunit
MDPARGSIDLDVRRGEIVGLAGLVGCGAKALLESIFGIREHSGQTAVDGKPARIRSPRDAMKAGIGFVPQDRKRDGLIPALPIEENLALSNFPILSRFCVLLRARKRRFSLEWISRLRIKCTGPLQPVRLLSGGNQQKVVLAKWLARNPTALLLDEPTRGVDIGAKAEIHEIIRALTERGVAILLASSEMPELLQLCDRVLVMREGHMISELRGQEMTEETILRHAVPGVQTISR